MNGRTYYVPDAMTSSVLSCVLFIYRNTLYRSAGRLPSISEFAVPTSAERLGGHQHPGH